ncbi:uncharacterized protein SPAPADRAFT_53912 [Spathaspora passalidarum NRRL Y-27907]|uniref:LicD/FKTN/FKRP nucleotidyltransferase domain-containing protein n=1 Tax=Spathaspora passalidarum (strain NRRL Y-27907 / 11-Y1) TaxID=619300 RepID=G3AEG3_SPAPN|nr:uncharacterized protein SPAPADRAFT_53912 [Spathaspora passalidarum NRRL Y-27907]EGW35751.1 hypothetical protein SPAPADRAFT_53912 [Spathaspora passalidarum NRRL Y-27907]
MVAGLLFLVTFTIISSSRDRLSTYNHQERRVDIYREASEPERQLDMKIEETFQNKIRNDLEDKFWLADTSIQPHAHINIPQYYDTRKNYQQEKPLLQPFDPRFTLGLYYYYINEEMNRNPLATQIEIPFNWYDWIDMSELNKYLLAPRHQKPNCHILDSDADAHKIEERKKKVAISKLSEEEKKRLFEDYARYEKERMDEMRRLEEERRKEEEREEKISEERKKQIEQEDQNRKNLEKLREIQEAREKARNEGKEEENKHKQSEKDKEQLQQIQQENSNKSPDDTKDNPQENKAQKDSDKTPPEAQKGDQIVLNKPEKRDNLGKRDENLDEPKLGKRDLHSFGKRDERFDLLQPVPGDRIVPIVETFCVNDIKLPYKHNDGHRVHPGFNVFLPPGKTTQQRAKLAGRSYMYSFAPPPSSVLFLTKEGSYSVGIKSNIKLLDNGIPESYIQEHGNTKLNVLTEYHKLKKNHAPDTHKVINDYEIHIPEDSFKVNFDAIIMGYQRKLNRGQSLTPKEQKYFESLKYSVHKVQTDGPTKYLEESRLLNTLLGDHYDWRFFSGVMYGTTELELTLHRMIRAWLSFTRKTGITTWIAHGSLLSWYWNGLAFPWDNDIDVQVPILDLHKLSLEYNQTLVVEDPEDGYGRYFLDCSTFITQREKGNGQNNIDARFIDIDTGLYIDITALAVSNTEPPKDYEEMLPYTFQKNEEDYTAQNSLLQLYNCRNNHFSSYEELSPLIKTSVEGEIGYIPQRYPSILAREYPTGMTSHRFLGHIFVPRLRLWVKEEDLFYFLRDRAKWNRYHSYNERAGEDPDHTPFLDFSYYMTEDEVAKLNRDRSEGYKSLQQRSFPYLNGEEVQRVIRMSDKDLLDFLRKDEVLIQYYKYRAFTSFHEQEIMRLTFGKSTANLMANSPDFPPIKYEPFAYRLKNDLDSYDERISRSLALEAAYKQGDVRVSSRVQEDIFEYLN